MNVLVMSGKKWEVTGEFRTPAKGEWYLSVKGGDVRLCNGVHIGVKNILKPVKWKPEDGDYVYLVEPQNNELSKVTFGVMWQPEYERGFIRKTKEEAEALLKELLRVAKEFEL